MRVYFIGAGPGAPDLITVRGAEILKRAPLVLYAGSLVSREILGYCSRTAEIHDTASLNLDQQEALYRRAQAENLDVARVHSGDPSIYGATAEQFQRLQALGIEYEVVPGVSSFTAAAALFSAELTKPEVAQTVILTRTPGRASPMPEGESLASLAAHKTTMCIFLSGANLGQTIDELRAHYAEDTPIVLIRRATWPDERRHVSTLGTLLSEIDPSEWTLTTMMIVGDVLRPSQNESRLYSASYSHRFRKAAR